MKRQVGRRLVANQEPITREQLHEDLATAPHDDTVRGVASMGAGAVVMQRISTVERPNSHLPWPSLAKPDLDMHSVSTVMERLSFA